MRSSLILKSALIGTLLSAGEPLTVEEIRTGVLAVRPIERWTGPLTAKRISDALRWPVRRGVVRRVGRGTYEAVPEAMSRTTRWRYRCWERRFDSVMAVIE